MASSHGYIPRTLVCLLWLCCGFASIQAANDERPNVLLIVVDDLRASLGCYGGPIISPNIDQLAAKSALFTNAMVQQSLCAPSRTSFLTGRRPDTTRLYDFGSYWRDAAGNFTTLPQHFKENGYFAASVGKVFHPGLPSGYTDDYPHSWSVPAYHPSTEQYIRSKLCPNLDGTLHDNVMCPVDLGAMPEGTLPDIQAAQRAEQILQSLADGRRAAQARRPNDSNQTQPQDSQREAASSPFFLGVGFRKPHIPWKYPKAYEALYPLESVQIADNPNRPEDMPLVAWNDYHSFRLREDVKALHIPFPMGTIPLSYHGPMRQSYYAASTYMDHQIGRVLHALEDAGFANNTIVLVVGDHGWQLGEHGEWCKFSNFELATRVPLLLHVPGMTDAHLPSPAWPARKFPVIDPLQQSAKKNTSKTQPVTKNRMWSKEALKRYFYYSNSVGTGRSRVATEPGRRHTSRRTSRQNGVEITDFVELVDIFPTLSDLAGIEVPPICPPSSNDVDFCAEGVSFAPLVAQRALEAHRAQAQEVGGADGNTLEFHLLSTPGKTFTAWKNATFSQYPRPGVTPDKSTDVPHLANITIMGYSMRTHDYHYTEWIGFNHTTFQGNWTDVKAVELYRNDYDYDQNQNLAGNSAYVDVLQRLSTQLQKGWRECLPVYKD